MAKLRVFELAKELNQPAKQLLQTIQKMGIPVTGNFSSLSDEQVVEIRKNLGGSKTSGDSSDGKIKGRRVSAPRSQQANVIPESFSDASSPWPRRLRKARKPEEVQLPVTEEVTVGEEKKVLKGQEGAPPAETSSVEEKVDNGAVTGTVEETVSATPGVKAEPSRETKTTQGDTPKTKESLERETVETGQQKEGVKSAEKKSEEQVKAESAREAERKKKGKKATPTDELDEDVGQFARGAKDFKNKKSPFQKEHEGTSRKFRDASDEFPRRKNKQNRRQKEAPPQPEVLKHVFNPRRKSLKIGTIITVAEFASLIGIRVPEIIKKLLELGIVATINQSIPGETAALIAAEFDVEVEQETVDIEDILKDSENLNKVPRAPIVTVMGHVDHGKTSLLDKIRSTQVTKGESGGITQHIGAYHVRTGVGHITFLDTPGHEAFTTMRARGVHVTDIVVLVVAVDDGVQPQTIEAIHHAQAAEVPIIVALNKVDRPEANPARIKQQLLEHQLIGEELGGDTIFVEVSAKTGVGIDALLEMIQLQAEVLELKASREGMARGVVIESQMSTGRGAIGTVLILKGLLKIGDYFVAGNTYGRVRAMFNDHGTSIKEAYPALPVEINGFNDVPETSEKFIVLEDEKTARQIAGMRAEKQKQRAAVQQQKTHLENLFGQIGADAHIELKILIKGDVQGSVEALQTSLTQIGNDLVSVRFIHTAVGGITETDVVLASASDAIIIGFNVRPDANARNAAIREGVEIRLYNVIYDAIDEVKAGLEGLLRPVIREEILGRCEIRQVFNASKQGLILGCYVSDGKIVRSAHARLLRNNVVIYDGSINSLRRFKDEVKEVAYNYECGVVLDYAGAAEGDTIEAYEKIEEAGKL